MDFVYRNNLKIDVYLPKVNNFKTLVYFHGGGLVEGSRSDSNLVKLFNNLKDQGICVFNCDYSLYPNAKFPDFILDAAYAIKKAFEMNHEIGGNGDIFVAGSSAGAYITMMLCSNAKFLNFLDIKKEDIKGWISESGQLNDHFHVLEYEEHLDPSTQRISKYAPIFYVDKGFLSNPILLLVYSDDIPNRVNQNIDYLEKVKECSKTDIELKILKGSHCDGSSKCDASGHFGFEKEILDFINKIN